MSVKYIHGLSNLLASVCQKLCSICFNACYNENMPIFTVHRLGCESVKQHYCIVEGSVTPSFIGLQFYVLHVSACALPSSGKLFVYGMEKLLLALCLYYTFINHGIFYKFLRSRVAVGSL